MLTPEWETDHEETITALAAALAARGLAAPASMALELLRPLSVVGAQALLLLEPLLAPWSADGGSLRRYVALLEDRTHIDRLLAALAEPTDRPSD